MDEFILGPKPYLLFVSNLLWNIVTNDWNLDENSVGKW